MPVAVYDNTFDTDMGPVPPTWYNNAVWDGTDGDPLPGCARAPTMDGDTNTDIRWTLNVNTWEALGVPSGVGATVTGVQGSVNVKFETFIGSPVSTSFAFTVRTGDTSALIATLASDGPLLDGSWTAESGAFQNVTPPRLSDDLIILLFRFGVSNIVAATNIANVRIDSVHVETTYALLSPCDLTVTPVGSATVYPHGTIQYQATGASTPVNWSVVGGAANGTIDSSGLYTAPGTAGTFFVQAASQADPTCTASAAAVVLPYPLRMVEGIVARASLSTYHLPNGGNPIYARACFGGLIRAGTVSHLNQALFNLYFAGAQNNDDFTAAIVNYGTPTPVIINDPQLGHEVWVDIAPTDIVDLAQFKSGYMGNVKLRRAGGDNTYRGPVVFRGMTLKYKKRQT